MPIILTLTLTLTPTLILTQVGSYQLCYRFQPRALPGDSPAAAVEAEAGIYPAIVLLVLAIDVSRAAPSGTAVGCESIITIPVTLPAEDTPIGGLNVPNATCRFGESGSTAARLGAGGAEVQCPTPTFGRSGETSLHLDFIAAGERVGSFAVFTEAPAFTVYDLGAISIERGSPRGGSYNVGFNVSLAGSGLVDYRGARCRFGGYQGSWAAVASGDVASCEKPVFPAEARHLKGEIGLEFSANGQCYGGAAAASFVVYNALVDTLVVRGGIAGGTTSTSTSTTTSNSMGGSTSSSSSTSSSNSSSTLLRITGEGFVSMAEGLCSLTPADDAGRPLVGGVATYGALSVLSPVEAVCLAPRRDEGEVNSGTIAHFQVGVLLNGVQREPSLWGAPTCTESNPTLSPHPNTKPFPNPNPHTHTLTLYQTLSRAQTRTLTRTLTRTGQGMSFIIELLFIAKS